MSKFPQRPPCVSGEGERGSFLQVCVLACGRTRACVRVRYCLPPRKGGILAEASKFESNNDKNYRGYLRNFGYQNHNESDRVASVSSVDLDSLGARTRTRRGRGARQQSSYFMQGSAHEWRALWVTARKIRKRGHSLYVQIPPGVGCFLRRVGAHVAAYEVHRNRSAHLCGRLRGASTLGRGWALSDRSHIACRLSLYRFSQIGLVREQHRSRCGKPAHHLRTSKRDTLGGRIQQARLTNRNKGSLSVQTLPDWAGS